jgi:agmatine deiminase
MTSRDPKVQPATPRDLGFAMPAEWERHAGCLMVWPTRAELWGELLLSAMNDYARVANAIARFEPMVMVCPPGARGAVQDRCVPEVRVVELPVDDSWARDSGPIFVRDAAGEVGAVGFGFNAWGNRWHPHRDDAALAGRIAEWLGCRFWAAPLVLEGGSFFVDGEGTVITTEQCLLNPNRNPALNGEQITGLLCDYLGATTVVWLPFGHSLDTGPTGTDGHVDGVLQFVGPGRVLLELVADPASPEHARGLANLDVLGSSRDAQGRSFVVELLDPGLGAEVSYANHYLADGAVIVPVAGEDAPALERLAAVYPGREIVAVPGGTIAAGGGGPHCITQQIPHGIALPDR